MHPTVFVNSPAEQMPDPVQMRQESSSKDSSQTWLKRALLTLTTLSLREITDIISKNNLNPAWDKTAGVKWITWGGDQWVSYDDNDTFEQKRDFANSRCLGGLMVRESVTVHGISTELETETGYRYGQWIK